MTLDFASPFRFLLACGFLFAASTALAQRKEPAPAALEQVGIKEKPSAQLPMDLVFRNARGKPVQLRDYFAGERPVLLSLTYSDCPMLCHLQLDGLVRSLQDIDWSPGEEFDVLNVSIDPKESWQRAQVTKRKHVEAYGRPKTASGWHFLTGEDQNIRRLADTVGFRYQFVPERNEYAHAACVIVCTPTGRVSRYLYGVDFPPQTVRLSLVEAGDGKIGSTFDQVLLFCFHYDAASGRYAPVAFRIMQLGGLLTMTTLLVGLVPFWFRRGRSKREHEEGVAVTKDAEGASDADVSQSDAELSNV